MSFVIGKHAHYRLLDFDDLCIMAMLHDGVLRSTISKYLGLTPPAISHRVGKYASIWGDDVYYFEGSRKLVSPKGYAIFKKMKETLYYLLNLPVEADCTEIFAAARSFGVSSNTNSYYSNF